MTIERHDTWYGWQPIEVKSFRTKRQGVSCVRYRLVAKAGGWYSPNSFRDQEGAERTLRAAARLSPLQYREVA